MSSIRYRPEIDGLRAVAVIPVLLYHMGATWLPGGFLGVDVFFVISGYLITSIILADYDRGEFSFAGFWLRRVRRILPVLITVVAATLVAARLLLYSPDVTLAARQGAIALLSLSNISFWLDPGGYWGPQAEDSLFLHTWSLSVEEQYYLVFPLLLFVTLRYLNRRLVPLALALTGASLLLYCYAAFQHPSAAFYFLPTRAWELGIGCILAVLQRRHPGSLRDGAAAAGLGLLAVLAGYAFSNGGGGFSPFLIASAAGAGAIIAFARDAGNPVNRLLSSRPLVYIGKLSYSLYLWHWPVLVFRRQMPEAGRATPSLALSVLLVVILSVASYHVVERRTRANPKAVPWILGAFAVVLGCAAALSTATIREDISRYNPTRWDGELYSVRPDTRVGPGIAPGPRDGLAISLPDAVARDAYANGGILRLYGGPTPEIVLLGDSHALMWGAVVDDIARELGVSVSFWAAHGTPPFFEIPARKLTVPAASPLTADERYAFDIARKRLLGEWRPKVVVIAAFWPVHDAGEVRDLLSFLGGIGSSVVLLEQPPPLFFGDKSAPRYLSFMGLRPNGGRQYVPALMGEDYRKGRGLVRGMAAAYPRTTVVPVAGIFLRGSEAWALDGRDVLYTDDDHLSTAGTFRARDALFRVIADRFPDRRPASGRKGETPGSGGAGS